MTVSCPHCELLTDTVGQLTTTTCGTGETPLFQSSLASPADGTFFADIFPSDCTTTLTFYQPGNVQIARSFTPTPNGTIAVTLTVPDVEKITWSCSSGPSSGSTCSIEWGFIYHYCRCCGQTCRAPQ